MKNVYMGPFFGRKTVVIQTQPRKETRPPTRNPSANRTRAPYEAICSTWLHHSHVASSPRLAICMEDVYCTLLEVEVGTTSMAMLLRYTRIP